MGGAGRNQPDPGEIERRLRELDKEIGKPRAHEPSALERLAAAKKAEKKVQSNGWISRDGTTQAVISNLG